VNQCEEKTRVLVVDDNPDNIELACQILEDQYRLLTASTGANCLALAREQQPDVILLDVMMPGMDGFEVLSALQENEVTRDIPVVFLTARYKDSDHIVKGLNLGALDYITKPFEDEILLARVGVAVRVKCAEETSRRQKRELKERVTELLEAQETLRATNLELDCANKELKAFSYSVSHDLRAPLHSIDGFSQVLLEECAAQLDEQGKECLQRVRRGTQHMGKLIDGLLKLSQVSSGTLTRQPVNLSDMASTIIAQLFEIEPQRQVNVELEEGVTAYADEGLVHAVLTNVLGNAWKYTSKKDSVNIKFGQQQKDHTTVFYVSDNGAGFNMRYAKDLFSAFHRLHKENEFPGTGIGLATVQRIIHRHGGSIWAESEVGKGATFFFTLGCVDELILPSEINIFSK